MLNPVPVRTLACAVSEGMTFMTQKRMDPPDSYSELPNWSSNNSYASVITKACSPLWALQKLVTCIIVPSIRNHHFLAKSSLTSHPIGSHGIEPQIFKSAISWTNSSSLIVANDFKIRSRSEIHGSISTHGPCGIICCCCVGAIDKGNSVALTLNPLPCVQSSWRRLAMRSKAAHVAILGTIMYCVSVMGS
jgi:hypothetical protein